MSAVSFELVARPSTASRPSWMAWCMDIRAPGAAALAAIVWKNDESQLTQSTSKMSRAPSVNRSCSMRSPPGAMVASQHS
eukprot:scaffold215768_cov31-Tisochrysis_lutea.AAC.2